MRPGPERQAPGCSSPGSWSWNVGPLTPSLLWSLPDRGGLSHASARPGHRPHWCHYPCCGCGRVFCAHLTSMRLKRSDGPSTLGRAGRFTQSAGPRAHLSQKPPPDTRSLVDPTSGPPSDGHRARTTHFPGWVESLCPGLGPHSLVAPTSLFTSLHREEGLCVLSGGDGSRRSDGEEMLKLREGRCSGRITQQVLTVLGSHSSAGLRQSLAHSLAPGLCGLSVGWLHCHHRGHRS